MRLAIVLAVASCLTAQTVDVFEQNKRIGRGVNILGYDPIWKDAAKGRFQTKHFRRIAEGGFQSVRVNLQAFAFMDDKNRLSDSWFKTMDWVVKEATAAGLVVILDQHNFVECAADAAMCHTRLTAFWKQVAPRYKDAPSSVIFEILNEPNGQVTPEMWNAWIKEYLALIRKSNPTRTVIIGPGLWNGIGALDTLELPEKDRNLIVTVHYYLPMDFTHQGAWWSAENKNLSGIKWGTDAERRKTETDFAGVQKWAEAHKRPILLGEFGAYEKGDIDSRVAYTSHVVRTAEKLGWSWTYWQFDSDFIVFDMAKDDWNAPIWKALIPEKK